MNVVPNEVPKYSTTCSAVCNSTGFQNFRGKNYYLRSPSAPGQTGHASLQLFILKKKIPLKDWSRYKNDSQDIYHSGQIRSMFFCACSVYLLGCLLWCVSLESAREWEKHEILMDKEWQNKLLLKQITGFFHKVVTTEKTTIETRAPNTENNISWQIMIYLCLLTQPFFQNS